MSAYAYSLNKSYTRRAVSEVAFVRNSINVSTGARAGTGMRAVGRGGSTHDWRENDGLSAVAGEFVKRNMRAAAAFALMTKQGAIVGPALQRFVANLQAFVISMGKLIRR